MIKCSKSNKQVEQTFLGKITGTYEKGKVVCPDCQKKPQ